MRLIDADELLKDEHQHYEYLSDEYYILVRDIESAPTVEPEQKKGKWTVTGTFFDFLKCSCCGYKTPWNQDVFSFCPHCGAEMEVKKC